MGAVVLTEAADFSLEALRRVAVEGAGLRFSKQALAQIEASHRDFLAYLDANQDRFIYGVTSEYGPHANRRVKAEERLKLKRHGVPFLGLSFGDGDLPEAKVRAMVFALLALIATGGTAVSARQARDAAKLLSGPMPRIPDAGLTSPGEMMPLFYLFQAMPSLTAGLQASAGNSALMSTGMAGIAALQARRRIDLAIELFALSAEAMKAPLEHYDPALKALWDDPFEAEALDSLNHWLEGAARDGRRPFQAPVSYRILPRVLGQALRAIDELESSAEAALAGLSSNPVFLRPGPGGPAGRTLSNGGFHDALIAQALDGVSAAWVDLAELAHRHVVKLHKGAISHLPDRLLPEGVHYRTGRSTSYIEFVPNDFIDEMRRLAEPALLSPGEPGASEQDDVSAPGFIACRNEARVALLFDRVLAVLAAGASQALHVTGRKPAPPLRKTLTWLRKDFPPVTERRELGLDAGKLARSITAQIEGTKAAGRKKRSA